MTQKLEVALAEAQRYLDELPAPPNEANTCEWVIRPLLIAAGYLNHEVLAQSGDVAKKYPDYTILSGTEHTWFLEAKAWSVALESIHVDQALNYAHSNGRRWVVLTNGKDWRLYDDHIKGISEKRLVATANLQDTPGMLKFLSAIGRESMMSRKVVEFASEKRLREFLAASLTDPTSAVVQAVVKVVRQHMDDVRIDPQVVLSLMTNAFPAVVPEVPGLIPPAVPVLFPGGDNVYTCSAKGLKAYVQFNRTTWTVLTGSQFSKNPVPSFVSDHKKRTDKLLLDGYIKDVGSHFEVVAEIAFQSPSAGSDLVVGGSTNGWTSWKDAAGQAVNKLLPKK